TEVSFQGMTAVNAYDGSEGWRTEPWQGRRDAFRLSADEAKGKARDADLDGPLVDWREKGHRVDYLGTEDVDATPAPKLRVTFKDGDVQIRYLDPDAFLEIRIEDHTFVRGVERISETDLGNYEEVAGVWMPLSLETGAKGERRNGHITIERAEPN